MFGCWTMGTMGTNLVPGANWGGILCMVGIPTDFGGDAFLIGCCMALCMGCCIAFWMGKLTGCLIWWLWCCITGVVRGISTPLGAFCFPTLMLKSCLLPAFTLIFKFMSIVCFYSSLVLAIGVTDLAAGKTGFRAGMPFWIVVGIFGTGGPLAVIGDGVLIRAGCTCLMGWPTVLPLYLCARSPLACTVFWTGDCLINYITVGEDHNHFRNFDVYIWVNSSSSYSQAMS